MSHRPHNPELLEDDMSHYFDTMAANWSGKYEKVGGHFEKRLETALSWLQAEPGQRLRILDYGCGSGVLMKELLARGHEVTGTDSSPGMIEQAGKELSGFGPVTLELIVSPSYEGVYLSKTFDVVYCLGVLEYLENPVALVGLLASVVRRGGYLIVSVPNRRSLLRKAEHFVHRHGGLFKPFPQLSRWTGHNSYLRHQKHQFTCESLKETALAAGLRPDALAYHVAPRAARALEGHRLVGMTFLARYVKE